MARYNLWNDLVTTIYLKRSTSLMDQKLILNHICKLDNEQPNIQRNPKTQKYLGPKKISLKQLNTNNKLRIYSFVGFLVYSKFRLYIFFIQQKLFNNKKKKKSDVSIKQPYTHTKKKSLYLHHTRLGRFNSNSEFNEFYWSNLIVANISLEQVWYWGLKV